MVIHLLSAFAAETGYCENSSPSSDIMHHVTHE
jgi:hypothetical protein